MSRRHPNVINQAEVEAQPTARGAHRFTRKMLGPEAGNRQLGASLMELAPGARSYPHHWHGANEESIYVIAGSGRARIGEDELAIGAGDWLAFPTGPAHAHQILNDSQAPLVYLCLSTRHLCEVVGYPDSQKVLALAGLASEAPWVRQMTRGDSLDYWDGEPHAHEPTD